MDKDFLNDPFYNYSKEELINKIAELRDVFDFPEETGDPNDPMYYNLGAIVSCPIEAIESMIKITKERNSHVNEKPQCQNSDFIKKRVEQVNRYLDRDKENK